MSKEGAFLCQKGAFAGRRGPLSASKYAVMMNENGSCSCQKGAFADGRGTRSVSKHTDMGV